MIAGMRRLAPRTGHGSAHWPVLGPAPPGSRRVLEISSCGSTHQKRHLRAARPVRRSGVTRLAAPGELPLFGSPAFPLHPSARGGGIRRVVLNYETFAIQN